MSAQSSQPLNVAVVGTGMSLAVFHRPSIIALKDKFTLHTVVERSGSGKAAEITGPSVKLVKTLEEALDDKEVDLVVISTPNNTHFPFAKQALEKGKHVLIEKPFCVTSQQGVQLDELAEKNGLVLSVYQNRRWDSDFLTVRELINAGKFGDIVDFQSSYDRYRPVAPGQAVAESWKTAPGQNNDIIYNLGSHVIDQAYVLFGMPEKLSCRFDDVRGMGVEEGFNMELFYPPQVASSKTPMVVTISGSILSCLPRQLRFRIRGSKGSFIKYGLDPQEANLKLIGGRTDVGEGFGEEKEEMWGELIEARKAEQGEKGVKNDNVEFVTTKYKSVAGNYNALYENLYDVIKSGDKSRLEVKPQQAIDVLRLIELGQKAAKEERVVYVQ